MKWVLGAALAFAVGFAARWLNLPVPSPPRLGGVALIAVITLGYMSAERLLKPSAQSSGQEAETDRRSP